MKLNRPMSILLMLLITALTGLIFAAFKPGPGSKITEVQLGRKLFFDKRFSINGQVACADCHRPEFAFADTAALSLGFDGRRTLRNSPGLTNLTGRPYLFWDGRVATLEEQVLHPVQNPLEMGMNLKELTHRLRSSKEYVQMFKAIYGKKPDALLAAKAIAAFEATLETGNSAFDRFMDGDSSAISLSAMRGREIFMNKGRCFDCHFGPDFTGDEFRNIGLFNAKNLNDSGRYVISRNKADLGAFRVPGLRNISLTAPYMHNGMFRTLGQVIDYYNEPDRVVPDAINRDTLLNRPLNLSPSEKSDLLTFLESLTSPSATKR